jgi:CDP-diglyceride synthetase
MIFLPMILLLVIITVLEVTQMDRSGVLNLAMRLLFGTFIVFYFGMSLITLIRKYMRSSLDERNTKGLTMMLIGTILGLLPILVYFTVGLISQGTELPGNDYVFITFAAIPIFFYLALHKLHSSIE